MIGTRGRIEFISARNDFFFPFPKLKSISTASNSCEMKIRKASLTSSVRITSKPAFSKAVQRVSLGAPAFSRHRIVFFRSNPSPSQAPTSTLIIVPTSAGRPQSGIFLIVGLVSNKLRGEFCALLAHREFLGRKQSQIERVTDNLGTGFQA